MFVAHFYPAFPISYFEINWQEMLQHLFALLVRLFNALNLPFAVILSCAALLCGFLNYKTAPRLAPLTGLLIVFGALWAAGFSQVAWVQANDFSVRYFFPTIFCFCIAASVVIIGAVIRWSSYAKWILGLIMGGYLVVSLLPDQLHINDFTAISATRSQANFARKERIKYITGDYWLVWPLVFTLLDSPGDAFGLTGRGEPQLAAINSAVNSDAATDQPVRALCLGDRASECEADLFYFTARPWTRSLDYCPDCVIYQLGS